MLRRLALLALLLLAVPASAHAHGGVMIERAAGELRRDSVSVHPDAIPSLLPEEADELRSHIADAGGDVYVAVLPADALHEVQTAEAVLDAVVRNLRRDGTYAVVVGGQFRARGTGDDRSLPDGLAEQAFDEHSDEGVGPTLIAFVDSVGDARGESGDDEGGRSGLGLGALAALAAAVLGLFAWRGRRRREHQLADVREAAEEDLVALGNDIRALDLDVELPDADARGKEDYARSLACYERAGRALDRARRPEDLEAVSAALEEGRFAMASAKARLAGLPAPERRPPCFFDPRHGPSTRDVEWAPPGGQPRPVPACEADALRVEEGEEPAAREVTVGGRRVPYWDASPAYGPWAGGFFGGGLFPAIFLGSMLGSGLGLGFPGEAEAGTDLGDGDLGGGDFDAGSDVGGSLGGGDFGGGDFGGGDF